MSGDERPSGATTDGTAQDDARSPAGGTDRLERQVLRLLGVRDGTLQLAELAAAVAALDDEPERTSERRLRIRLHHRCLPRLDDRGLVSFDPSAGRVTLTADGTRSEVAGRRGFGDASSTFERRN